MQRRILSIVWLIGLIIPSAPANAADSLGSLAFAELRFEGEYGSDLYNGKATAPATGAIYSIREDGSGLQPLADVGGVTTYPRYSPQGDWLYFQSNASGQSQVYRCRADGTEVVNLSASRGLGPEWSTAFGCALSANGERLVYSVQGGSPTPRIVACQADGQSAAWVAPDLGYIYMASPDATGARIAFSGPAREYRLSISERPFAEARLLTPDHPDSYVPQFTRDGESLLFLRKDGDLYSVDIASTKVRRLTQGNDYVEFHLSPKDLHGSTDGPHLSPDGKRVAYIARRDGVPQVCMMNLDGTEQRQITHRNSPCGRVRWSPDGRRLAFVSFEPTRPQLFIISAAGGEPKQITKVEGAVYWMDWRPES
ncbi:MAG TPA: DPP IV N-terminal domain-containing protein [Pirellulales bacterium]|nr:DPP IV N-terminal domain-containing protein [Pirellulales bacterium]